MNKKALLLLTFPLVISGCGISRASSSTQASSSETVSSISSESLTSSKEEKSSEFSSESSKQDSSSEFSSSESSKESSSEPKSSSSSIEPIDPEVLFYDVFYAPESDVKITVNMTNKAAYKLSEYGYESTLTTADIYHPGDLTITINGDSYSFPEVGLRKKGNTSRSDGYIDEGGHFYGNFNFKISFSTDFSDNDYFTPKTDKSVLKDRKFGAAKKIDLKWNRNHDNTFTKQAYAYYMFENEGLLASKTKVIDFTLNSESDTYKTKMLVEECIDKQALKKKLPKAEQKGNLYKGNWPCDLTYCKSKDIGVEDCTKSYFPIYDLKTNDDVPDHTLLNNVINTMNAEDLGVDQATLKRKFDSIIDAEAFVKYAALCWLIGNPDDLRNNRNNSYYYFNSKNNLMYVIPRDTDRCFGILDTWEVDMANQYPTTTKDCPIYRNYCACPLFWRSIIHSDSGGYSKKWPVITEYENLYKQYCIEYYNKYMSVSKFKEFTDKFANLPSYDVNYGGKGEITNQSFGYYANAKTQVLKDLGWIK